MEMVFLITAVLLILGYYTEAQNPDCDFRQYVGASERYYISNPGYPYNYRPGVTCRYIAICPQGYNCRIDCYLDIPTSPNCATDRFLVSTSGDPLLTGAQAYCGIRTLSAVSNDVTLSIGLIATSTSRGGRYTCNLTAQLAPVTPAPTVCRCGERKQTRIVGGEATRVNEYTMMAGLVEVATNSIHCGGVIISEQYIMTAAHCVYRYQPATFVVAVGAYYIENQASGTRYRIAQFRVHEQFNEATYDYDIALVLTQVPIQFNENVLPVCLPFKYSSNPTGGNVTLLGWGTTSFGGPTSNELRKVIVSVITPNTCSATETNISNRKICTFAAGKDACQFDSGGPVLHQDPSTNLMFSVGIVSYGESCASRRPAVHSSVITLLNWVVNNANSRFCLIR